MSRAPDLLDLSGETAPVTGAAGGIGYGIAEVLAAAGAHVVIADLDGDAAAAACARLGSGAASVTLDVRSEAAVEAAIASRSPCRSASRLRKLGNQRPVRRRLCAMADMPNARPDALRAS